MKKTSVEWSLILWLIAISLHLNAHANEYDPSASVFLFQKQMAKRGNAESQFKLGLMYETGSGANNSSALATSWYRKAARQNYKPASNRLTYLEIKKSGFNASHKKWLKELKADARFNEGEALFLLGQMYSEGTAVNKSLTRSLKYLRKAAGGNIPGSEAEITRVEQELNLLQKQYITEKDKKNITPVVPLVVKKIVRTPPKPVQPVSLSGIKKNQPKKTATRKTRTTKTTLKTVSKKPKSITKKPANKPAAKKPATKKIQVAKTHIKKPLTVKKQPQKKIIKEEPHPMDSICGGRNRFSRGCR